MRQRRDCAQEARVLLEALTQERDGLGATALVAAYVGQADEREESAAAGGRRVLARRVAHLDAQLEQFGGLGVARLVGVRMGLLEHQVREAREQREALVGLLARLGVEAVDAVRAGQAADERRDEAEAVEALLLEQLPRLLELRQRPLVL